MFKVKRRS